MNVLEKQTQAAKLDPNLDVYTFDFHFPTKFAIPKPSNQRPVLKTLTLDV